VRWAILVLSWLAFLIAGYLAIHSVSGTSVAGCGVGSSNGCNVVLTSSWSKWLGVPVAVLGLAVYAALASLSPLLWWRNEEASRWITTAIVLLSVVAAGASVWFIGVQVFAIHEYCKFCLVTDTCGILLGVIASFEAVRSASKNRPLGSRSGGQTGLHALRSTMPVGTRQTAATIAPAMADPPALGLAFGGAVPLLALLIAGQMLFATKTYEVQKVALSDTIEMTGSLSGKTSEDSAAPSDSDSQNPGESRAEGKADDNSNEISNESAIARTYDSSESKETRPNDSAATGATEDVSGDNAAKQKEEPQSTPAAPAKERLVKFLGGKLTLDVYKHPLIGSPEAPHIAIEMVSYDCPHCRKMAPMMTEVLARYGDQVALLIMPVPLDKDCNKLVTDPTLLHPGACGTSRRVCGVAKLNPSVFAKFHEFLMTGKEAPPMERIVPKANGLVDRDQLRTFVNSPEAKKQVDGYVELFGKLQAQSKGKTFGLPVQILGDKIVTGEVEKIDDVFKAWEENLGVTPK
jgi:uncharacterized membrane protein/thiol-disulfide isomerase/thioredoxin